MHETRTMVRLTCLSALLVSACIGSNGPSDIQSNTLGSDSGSGSGGDSNDYSAWFSGMSLSEIEDFERQDDADHLAYPQDEISEPDHDPKPGPVAIEAVGSGNATVDAGVDAGSGSATVDASVAVDAGVSVDATVSVDGPIPFDASVSLDAAVADGPVCPTASVAASLKLGVNFDVSVRDQFLGTFGPIRDHNIWARGRAVGAGELTLAGSLTATASSWTATVSVTGSAGATFYVHADQNLVSRRRSQWFALGDSTLTGNVTFADSVTFTQTCDPPGVVATTPGTPAITANVRIQDLSFYGYFFPRLQGPVITRIRGAISQFLLNFGNRQLPGLIQPYIFGANQAYATKKAELLAALVAKLPPGCGCPVRN